MSAEKSSGAMSRPAMSRSIAWFFSDAREGAEAASLFVLNKNDSSLCTQSSPIGICDDISD